MRIILASQSPRRLELLKGLGFDFEIINLNIDETYPSELKPNEVAGFLSQIKAESYPNLQSDELLITADTVVVSQEKILGKPIDKQDAIKMLLSLSNKVHQVYTAITLRTKDSIKTFTDIANVECSHISEEEANFYTEYYQPMDKAGAYGIQEWLGMAKINRIEGSFYTIMGLPTHLIYEEIKKMIK